MAGKRPRQEHPLLAAMKGPRQQTDKITLAINANLQQCCVCSGPLTPPLFQCTKGHVSCSRCYIQGSQDDEVECLICHKPETNIGCRAVEHVLTGLPVPCPFQQYGFAEMVPYKSEQAHKALCAYAWCHCPISSCTGYAGKPLREHVRQDHPSLVRTVISPRCLTPLMMRAHEQARMVRLGDDDNGDGGAEFLVIVGQYKQLGRALSVVRLVDESVDEKDFKHRIEVVGKDGVLSLSGDTMEAERLVEPYEASPFLFVPNETWDSPEGIRVSIELK